MTDVSDGRIRFMKNAQKGFTLIEAMVVVAIVGIGSALAVPSISDLSRRHRENEAIALVEGALRDARNLARVSRRCVKVTVSSGVITSEKATCSGYQRYGGSTPTISTPPESTSVQKIGSQIKVMQPSNSLIFHPYGGTTNIDEITIEIRSSTSNNNIAELVVFPGIGTVRKR